MKQIFFLGLLVTSSLLAEEPVKKVIQPLQEVNVEMANAANAFLASLNKEQVAKAVFPFEAEQRENWGFVPRERKGIPLEQLDEKQIELVRGLLKSALSDPGLKKVDAIMALEAFLAEIEKRPDFRNPKAYFTSIFGKPSASGTW